LPPPGWPRLHCQAPGKIAAQQAHPGHAGTPVVFDTEAAYVGNVFSVGPQLRDEPMFRSAAA
jgi:hypothetical protein